ncbi:MAG: T9SS C-terminal target domain-containing protein [Bacteroidetes bacterium]|nr:MAG: T9SS C-terminal target domain-containing protein [Bacteroidota bacterium]
MYKYLFFTISWLACGLSLVQAGHFPPGFTEELIATDLNPVALTMDPHGRVWIAEKHGLVRIIDQQGQMLPDPFIQLEVDDFNERGLLGIALHPQFEQFPFVYLYYTVPNARHNRVSRFLANGDLAVPGSEEVLLELDPLTGSVHNGGGMVFGADGMLYIATGDAAESTNGQKLNSLHAKILRLHPDGSIPRSNPFYHQLEGKYRAVWAYGLRNPFSLAYDYENDRLFACDVGLGDYEEIDVIEPGKNYGWPIVEGPAGGQSLPQDYQDPLYAYSHDEGCAIVGAAFYQPQQPVFPQRYHHQFFFADYCNNYIKVLNPDSGEVEETFATGVERPLAFWVDVQSGNMYFLSRAGIGSGSEDDNTRTRQGSLWKIGYQGNGKPFISVQPESVLSPRDEEVTFSIRAGGSRPLTYQWQRDGANIAGATAASYTLDQVSLADDGSTFRCLVRNAEGADTSRVARLYVTANRRPQPRIILPQNATTFQAGDLIHFQGTATDPEEGNLGVQALSWRVDWHHDQHTHPVLTSLPGVASGFWEVPRINETDPDVWYRIYLTATDAQGLSKTVYHELFPDFAHINFQANAPITLNVDGALRQLPAQVKSIKGLQRVLLAPEVQIVGDSIYYFEAWDDGSTQRQKIFYTPLQDTTIGLRYGRVPLGTGSGLFAQYFYDPALDFSGQVLLERTDSVVNFRWDASSPDPALIPSDSFTVRWLGEVQALLTDTYTFYVRSDDGARLWVNDELLIDQWHPQATEEHEGRIELQAGQRVPIRLEYMEVGGGANVALSWSNSKLVKQIIPRRQLYPLQGGTVAGTLWLDRNKDLHLEESDVPLQQLAVLLFKAEDQQLVATTQTDHLGHYEFNFLKPHTYFLQMVVPNASMKVYPAQILSLAGQSPDFELAAGATFTLDVPFFEGLAHPPARRPALYPNPVSSQVFLQMDEIDKRLLTASWYNNTGQRVQQLQIPVQQHRLYTLDMGGLAAGMYLLEVRSSKAVYHYKVIKQE